MEKLFSLVCHVVLAINVFQTTAKPGGFAYLELNSLENLCDKACHYHLEIWVNCDAKKNDSDCKYGYAKTGTFVNAGNTIFNNSLGNALANPLMFNFSVFGGTLGIGIVANDQRGSEIKKYRHHQSYYPKNYYKQQWENITMVTSASTMDVSYSVFCYEHYYGPACSVGCLPGKTYKCDVASGNKICTGGWLGPQCNCIMTSKNTCNIGTGEKICYKPWYGKNCNIKCTPFNNTFTGYSCGKSGQKICLSGWYGRECNETTPAFYTSQPFLPPTSSHSTLLLTSQMTSHIMLNITSQIMLNITSLRISYIPSLPHTLTSVVTTGKQHKSNAVLSSVITSTKKSIGTSEMSGIQTEKLASLPSTSTLANHSLIGATLNTLPSSSNYSTAGTSSTSLVTASQVDSISPSSSVIQYNPGVAKARKKQQIWWIILVVLIVLAILTVAGLLAFKYKIRNRRICDSQSELQLKCHKEQEINGNNINEKENSTYIEADNTNIKTSDT